MNCLVPGCGTSAEPCGFCFGHIQKIPVGEREHIVAMAERIGGKSLRLPEQPVAAVQGELFGEGVP